MRCYHEKNVSIFSLKLALSDSRYDILRVLRARKQQNFLKISKKTLKIFVAQVRFWPQTTLSDKNPSAEKMDMIRVVIDSSGLLLSVNQVGLIRSSCV